MWGGAGAADYENWRVLNSRLVMGRGDKNDDNDGDDGLLCRCQLGADGSTVENVGDEACCGVNYGEEWKVVEIHPMLSLTNHDLAGSDNEHTVSVRGEVEFDDVVVVGTTSEWTSGMTSPEKRVVFVDGDFVNLRSHEVRSVKAVVKTKYERAGRDGTEWSDDDEEMLPNLLLPQGCFKNELTGKPFAPRVEKELSRVSLVGSSQFRLEFFFRDGSTMETRTYIGYQIYDDDKEKGGEHRALNKKKYWAAKKIMHRKIRAIVDVELKTFQPKYGPKKYFRAEKKYSKACRPSLLTLA